MLCFYVKLKYLKTTIDCKFCTFWYKLKELHTSFETIIGISFALLLKIKLMIIFVKIITKNVYYIESYFN